MAQALSGDDLHVSIRRLRLDPFRGVLADGFTVHRRDAEGEPVLRVERTVFRIRWADVIRRRPCIEEVHVLGLFSPDRDLRETQVLMDDSLAGENDAEAFGLQVVVDEWDEPTEVETKLLIGATALGLEEAVDAIHRFGGLAIAAHIDREGFGLLGQLGFFPDGLKLDAVEVSPRASPREWEGARAGGFPVITSSDAHRLADIGRSSTSFLAGEPSFEEIGKALTGRDGRKVVTH